MAEEGALLDRAVAKASGLAGKDARSLGAIKSTMHAEVVRQLTEVS